MALYKLNTDIQFGKHKGKKVNQVAYEDYDYLLWLNDSNLNISLHQSVIELIDQYIAENDDIMREFAFKM